MILFVAAALVVAAQSQDSLLQKIQARIAEDSGAFVGLAYLDPGSADTLFLNANVSPVAVD